MKQVSLWATSTHIRPALDHSLRRNLVSSAKVVLQSSGLDYDMLVVTGVSGCIFGASLADALGMPLCIVRKDEVPASHSGRIVEGPDDDDTPIKWLFVDDLMSTGATYIRVQQKIKLRYTQSVHVGVFLYQDISRWGLDQGKVEVPVFGVQGKFNYHPGWANPM